ncbi:WD40 repeat domain-containing protein [Phaeobacter gallaeciensis]|uniref:WD40 repeat domain-containing protein n=1 Tax=Phaeobacter gallaeciensis TaxID=60890 RepID=UPI000BBCB0B7|nr:hypothetical protein [Phaeobacter gallaeciensis]ATF18018.1 WD40 repeat protein [Phaeobacter gallaeciensis]ATF22127.1 WD40 repeat protein [Phaeobacter gallaeciensis]
MTQHKPPQAMTLFDLIARTWDVKTEVRALLFNAKGSSLAAQLADGQLAFVSVHDAESPDSRVRVEADTGRSSIRPRSKPLPPPVLSETSMARTDVSLCRLEEQGFAFAHSETGGLWRATARGQTLAMTAAGADTVTALATLSRSGQLAVAHETHVALSAASGGAEIANVSLDHSVARIAVSDDESLLACWGAGQVSIVRTKDLSCQAQIACDGKLLSLEWSPCRCWLVAGCEDKAVLLVDVSAGTADRIVDFPASVLSAQFSDKAKAVVASGAFRVVGWSLPDLPFGDHTGEPIETGKPGLTIVDRIAVHPKRDLCAVSYGTGLVMLSRIGHPDEMLVREGTGSAVTALAWSDDGTHLGIGGEDGSLSIATFPKNMFK